MKHQIDIQIASTCKNLPSKKDFEKWIKAAIQENITSVKICVRIVDESEMTQLNERYRKKQGSTNVLSFDYREKNDQSHTIFGDIIICASVVEKEAKKQLKNVMAHWAHMAIHGCLHLQGFDHQTEKEAQKMEQLESEILKKL